MEWVCSPLAQLGLNTGNASPRFVCHLGGTDHAVFNHTGARFNAPAAAEAYLRTFAWFERFVAGRKR